MTAASCGTGCIKVCDMSLGKEPQKVKHGPVACSGFLDKQLMACIFYHLEPRMGDSLRKDPRVFRRYQGILASHDDQRGVLDTVQVLPGIVLLNGIDLAL